MFKKLMRENSIPTIFFILLYSFFAFKGNQDLMNVVKYLAITGYGTSFITTTMFFIIPAQFGGFAFAFMFMSIILRLFLFGLIGVAGFSFINPEYANSYFLLLIITLIIYKVSGTFLIEGKKTNSLKKETS